MAYEPHVFDREDGSQILVSVFTDDDGQGTIIGLDVAERPERGATWGPPLSEVREP